jgi:hypothetical protein
MNVIVAIVTLFSGKFAEDFFISCKVVLNLTY